MNPTLLKDLILAGHRVACKTKDWRRKVFLFVILDWRFEWTVVTESIEECLSDGLSSGTYTEEDIKEDFTWEYKIVTPLPQLPQVWDTVEVLEICRELPWFDSRVRHRKNMVWKRYLVEKVDKRCNILLGDCLRSSRQVAKCDPDVEFVSEELEVITLNGKKYIELKE